MHQPKVLFIDYYQIFYENPLFTVFRFSLEDFFHLIQRTGFKFLNIRPRTKSIIANVKHLRVNRMSSQFSVSNNKYILKRISKDLESSILRIENLFL